MDPLAKNVDQKKLIFLCVDESNRQKHVNECKWYQYDEILDDNWRMEDLDENVTIHMMDENTAYFVTHAFNIKDWILNSEE